MFDTPGVHLVLDREALTRDSRAPFPFRVKVVTKGDHVEWPTLHGDVPAFAHPRLVPKYLSDQAKVLLVARREALAQIGAYRSGPA